jgi:hypothetical protein
MTAPAQPASPDLGPLLGEPLPADWAREIARAARGRSLSLWIADGEGEPVALARAASRGEADPALDLLRSLFGSWPAAGEDETSPRSTRWPTVGETLAGLEAACAHTASLSDAVRATAFFAASEARAAFWGKALDFPPAPAPFMVLTAGARQAGGVAPFGEPDEDAPLESEERSWARARALARSLCLEHGFSQVAVEFSCAQTPAMAIEALERADRAARLAREQLGLGPRALGLDGRVPLRLCAPGRDPAIAGAAAVFWGDHGLEAHAPVGLIQLQPFAEHAEAPLEAALAHEWTHALDWLIGRRTAPSPEAAMSFSSMPPDVREQLDPRASKGLALIERALFQAPRRAPAPAQAAALSFGAENVSRSVFSALADLLPAGSAMPDRMHVERCAAWLAWSARAAAPDRLERRARDLFEMGVAECDFPEVDAELLASVRALARSPAVAATDDAASVLAQAFARAAAPMADLAARQTFPDFAQASAGPFARASAELDGAHLGSYWREPHEMLARGLGRPASLAARVRLAFAHPHQTPLFSLAQQRDLREGFALFVAAAGLRAAPAPRPAAARLEAFAALAQRAAGVAARVLIRSAPDGADAGWEALAAGVAASGPAGPARPPRRGA